MTFQLVNCVRGRDKGRAWRDGKGDGRWHGGKGGAWEDCEEGGGVLFNYISLAELQL